MAIYHDVEQSSLEWLKLRLGLPTASGFGDLMKLDFTARTGEMPKTFLYKRIAEKLSGEPLIGFTSRATEQGKEMEDEACRYFQMEHVSRLKHGGFVTTDDGASGCSPDALIGDDAGLEIKCPNPETHIRYLVEGKLPADYVHQVHGSIYVTGRKEWHFLSYHRGLPAFHLVVERDEEICEKIHDCLTAFRKDFDALFERLSKL